MTDVAPPEDKSWLHGTLVPEWVSENLPPGVLSDPRYLYGLIRRSVSGLERIAEDLIPF